MNLRRGQKRPLFSATGSGGTAFGSEKKSLLELIGRIGLGDDLDPLPPVLRALGKPVTDGGGVPAVDDALQRVLADPAELRAILVEAIRGFAAHAGAADLTVILPEAQRQKLEGAVRADLVARAGSKVSVRFDDGFRFGFRLAPEGGGYTFEFTDDGFREIFLKFLAPRFREYFFEK